MSLGCLGLRSACVAENGNMSPPGKALQGLVTYDAGGFIISSTEDGQDLGRVSLKAFHMQIESLAKIWGRRSHVSYIHMG